MPWFFQICTWWNTLDMSNFGINWCLLGRGWFFLIMAFLAQRKPNPNISILFQNWYQRAYIRRRSFTSSIVTIAILFFFLIFFVTRGIGTRLYDWHTVVTVLSISISNSTFTNLSNCVSHTLYYLFMLSPTFKTFKAIALSLPSTFLHPSCIT